MSDSASGGSAGVFTTQKLQALLDCRRVSTVVSRAALADAMNAAGDRISVHGIDAWFKTNDSNYGIERESLEKGRRSYAVPKRRWAVLLDVFDLTMDDLTKPDAEFRRWCFDASRAPSTAAPRRARSVALYVDVSNGKSADTALACDVLDASDLDVETFDTAGADPESEFVRALLASAALVLQVPDETPAPSELLGALEHAQRLGRAALCLCSASADVDALLERGADVLLDASPQEAAERVLAQLPQRDGTPARVEDTPHWTTPEPVTDRPSIAVLPFVSLSGDDDSNFLAEGLTEDITTLLSRIPEFFVIARSTMQVYRDAPADAATLHRDLGVRFLLKGSLRSNGQKVRISAELVDTTSRASVFAERFDRPLDDLFDVQDELTVAICAQLEPRLRLEDMAYGARSGSVTAWRQWQEGWHWLFVDAPQPLPTRSLQRFAQAIELESDYALGHAGLSLALSTGMLWGGLGPDRMDEARDHAETAYKLLPENPVALYAMALLTFVEPGNLKVPLDYVTRAVELEPSNPMYRGVRGYLMANLGDAQAGVDECLYATRLSPKDSREPFLCYMLGASYIANEQYELAIETMTRCRRFSEVDFIWMMIAYAHTQLGERDRAIAALKRIDSPRPYRFYRFALESSFWQGRPLHEKHAFLELFAAAGIE